MLHRHAESTPQYIDTLGNRRRRLIRLISATLAGVIIFVAPLHSQNGGNVDVLLATVAAADQQAEAALAQVNAAKAHRDELQATLGAAESAVFVAKVDLDIASGRSDGLSSALALLTQQAEEISALQRQLAALPPNDAGRADMELTIRTYREVLNRDTARYGRQSSSHMRDVAAARQVWRSASQARDQLRTQIDRAEQDLETANAALATARETAEAERARLAEATISEHPPYLETITVTQNGQKIYQAAWSEDLSIQRALREMITELQRQIADLEPHVATTNADIARYSREARTSLSLQRPLIDEIEHNEMVNATSVALYRWGNLILAVTGVAQVATAVRLAVVEGTAAATASGVAGEVLVQNAIVRATTHMARAQWLRGQVARNMIAIQARQIALNSPWIVRGAAIYTIYDVPNKLSKAFDQSRYQINQVDMARFTGAIDQAGRSIADYDETRSDLAGRRASRKSFETVMLHEINRLYQEQQNDIADVDSGFWRTVLIGKIWTPDTMIALALANAGMAYLDAYVNAHNGLIRIAREERDMLEAEIETRRQRIAALQNELALAPTRRLDITTNEQLEIGDGEQASIELTFSAALNQAPLTVIGNGTIARPPGPGDGVGLPLPGPDDGAVLVQVSGSGTSWSGSFDTGPLEAFADQDDIVVQVSGTDFAGKALDANPGTSASLTDGNWTYWEETKSFAGSGRGGQDRWHLLNFKSENGTSYSFVVDASGSMGDNSRMVRVKQSANAFVQAMEPGDEVALWAFFDCGNIQLALPFTRDKQNFLTVLRGIEPRDGTPLAAAIASGGDYLIAEGRYDRKTLVVLTDGEESCDGDPAAAAGRYRSRVALRGDIGSSSPDPQAEDEDDEPTTETEVPEDDLAAEEEPPVTVQPADRITWEVSQRGSMTLPTIVLTKNRFHEWGRDGACNVLVTQQKFYIYYGAVAGANNASWGVNSQPFSAQTRAAAQCRQGQVAMDGIRQRWGSPPGTDRSTADADIQGRVEGIVR